MRLSPAKAIAFGALTVGTLDILDAFIYFYIRSGARPMRILQGIAAGLLGRTAAIQGGVKTAALGLALHFLIATCIVTVYFLASRVIPVLRRRTLICGVIYGPMVWAFMNYVVIPHSATGGGGTPVTPVLINGLLIHIFGVGLPSALFARMAR